jgi:hypothetical protein
MSIGDVLTGAVKGFVLSGGNPAGAFAGAATAGEQSKAERKAQRRQEEFIRDLNTGRENINMAMGSGEFQTTGLTFQPQQPQQVGFFERLGNFGTSLGNTLLTGFESAVPQFINRQIFGGQRPLSSSQGPALTTVTNIGAQESQSSGTIQAGAGALLPSLLGGARSLLKSPAGQLGLGTAAGGALSLMTPDGKKMRITRKMKSQARTVLNIAGGNISVAADILNISDELLISILLKRFRNDGPVVTKAALRKTKSTIRRLHSMQDVLKSITPTAAGRKRAPVRRSMSTTLIKN